MFRLSNLTWLVPALVVTGLTGCGSSSSTEPPAASISPSEAPAAEASSGLANQPELSKRKNPALTTPAVDLFPEVMISTSLGKIKIRLNAEKAPITVENFLENYTDRKFYEGTIFHHVDEGFIVIGGGYTTDGDPKPTRTAVHNEAHNGLKNKRGTIAMARHAESVDSATSQFFFNVADNESLDYVDTEDNSQYGYCVFGEVVDGMDVVERIASVPVKTEDDFPKKPVETVTIESVTRLR